jgi:hypothetical protein
MASEGMCIDHVVLGVTRPGRDGGDEVVIP